MANEADLGERALIAIRSEPRIGPHFKPGVIEVDAEGTAMIEAEVDNVAIKRFVLERRRAIDHGCTADERYQGEPFGVGVLVPL